jgi:hypothetical protein
MYLFRGESLSPYRSDRKRVDFIEQFHQTGAGLFTMLANGGNPYLVERIGLHQAIRNHIVPDGKLNGTHFLSFSASEERASFYATNRHPTTVDVLRADLSDATLWGWTAYVLFRLDVANKSPHENTPGFYRLDYARNCRALLVDAITYLSNSPATDAHHAEALRCARRDAEWLVLPLDAIEDGTRSALLRKGPELVAQHYVDADYFATPDTGFIC